MDTARFLRTLLIDSDALCRDVLVEILHGLDADCATASSGSEGLWMLCAGHYDVVVIAETLPDRVGAMVTRVILEGGGGQPVILGLGDSDVARQSFLAAGADDVMPSVPELTRWRAALRRIDPRVDSAHCLDPAALEAWRDYQGPETYQAVVQDYVRAGSAAMSRLRQAIARADAADAARTVRVFGNHSRVVGAGALARACEDLEAAFRRGDLKSASGHLLRVQDDWLRVRSALEPQPYRLAG